MKGIKQRLDRLEKAARGTTGQDLSWDLRSFYADEVIRNDAELRDYMSILLLNLWQEQTPEVPEYYRPELKEGRSAAWKLENMPELREAAALLVEKMLEIDGDIRAWIKKGLIIIGQDGQPLPLLDAFMLIDFAEIFVANYEIQQLKERPDATPAEIERLEKKRDDTWTALQERWKTNKYRYELSPNFLV